MHRELFEQVRDSYKTLCEHRQPGRIIHVITEAVGLTDKNGVRYMDRKSRNHTLAPDDKRRYSPQDFNLEDLAEAIWAGSGMGGTGWREALGFRRDSRTVEIPRLLRVQEEAAAPIGPSIWGNVAAWTASVGGLMQASYLEGVYDQADFELLGLFPNRQPIFWQGGERYINILGPADPAPEVGIGEEFPDMAMSAMWVEPGAMKKYGGKILVAKETAVIDISGGQLLQKAKDAGKSIPFREHELIIDLITGATNNWRMGFRDDTGATGYDTYGPTITRPDGSTYTIPNDIVNPFNDLGTLYKSDESIAQLYHPLTGNPIKVNMDTVVMPTSMAAWAMAINAAATMTPMTQTTITGAQAAAGTFPNFMFQADNPWKGVVRRGLASQWLDQRHRASATQTNPNRSAGLALTGANVNRWYRMDPARFACRRAFWEPMSLDLNPGDYTMAVQNIAAGSVFSVAVQYQVLNPYAVQRGKNS